MKRFTIYKGGAKERIITQREELCHINLTNYLAKFKVNVIDPKNA